MLRSPVLVTVWILFAIWNLGVWTAGLSGFKAVLGDDADTEEAFALFITIAALPWGILTSLYVLLHGPASAPARTGALALLVCTSGDYFLARAHTAPPGAPAEALFVQGVAGFGTGQLLLAVAFSLPDSRVRPGLHLVGALPVAAVVAGVLSRVYPLVDPAMRGPLILYGAAIGLMAWRASARAAAATAARVPAAAKLFRGALLFLLSDSLIAFTKWGAFGLDALPQPVAHALIITTYWAALVIISDALAAPVSPSTPAADAPARKKLQ